MPKPRKAWVFSPQKKSKSSASDPLKDEVNAKAVDLIEKVLKPKHVKPPSEGSQHNYITDLKTKWIGSTIYFICINACSGPNAIAPFFETKFARIAHSGDGKFSLSFMRHNDKWFELHPALSVDVCMAAIRDNPLFHP